MSDAPIVQVNDDGTVVYRASALGGCIYALVAARQGRPATEVSEDTQRLFDAGHETEAKYVLDDLTNRQMEVSLQITDKIRISGHIDGTLGSDIIEIKSQSDGEYEKSSEGPLWDRYKWQVSVYHHALKHPVVIHRVRRSDLECKKLVLGGDMKSLDDIVDRVFTIESLATEQDLICPTPNFFCQYQYLHPTIEPVDEPELEELLAEYLEIKAMIRADEKKLADVKARITEALKGRSKVVLMSGRSVSRSEFEVKEHVVKGGKQSRFTVTDA